MVVWQVATMSRPTKLTDETQEKLCEALRQGNFRAIACAYAGVGIRSFTEWMTLGKRKPRSRHGAFRRAVLDAEALVERKCVAVVLKAALNDDVKSAQWWLEHKARTRWATTQKHEHSGPKGKPIEVNVDDARQRLLDRVNRIAESRRPKSDDPGSEPGASGGD